MEAQKKLGSQEQKHESAQSILATLEQHFHITLIENEVGLVAKMARNYLNSSATPREFREAIKSHMLALLSKDEPAHAAELRAQPQGVAGSEKGGIHSIAETERANNSQAGSPKEAGTQATAQSPMVLDPKHDQETPQEISQRILSISEENFSKVRALFSAEPQPKTRQEQIERLFGILKDGGSLGIHYSLNEGESKTPDQVLSSMKGDCDELALLFIASARKLNIDTTDMGIAVLGFVVFGKEKEILHATVFRTTGENRLLDLTHDSPEKLESIDERGFTKAYENKRLATGQLVLRVGSMEILSTPEEMVSVYFRDTASYYEIAAKPEGKPVSSPLLEKSISLRETALSLNPKSVLLQYGLIRLRVESAEKYADKEDYERAEQHATRALQYPIASSIRELAPDRKRDIARAYGLRGEAYANRNEYAASLGEFTKSVQVNPEDYRAYEGQAVAHNELGSNTGSGEKASAREHFLAAKDAIETALTKFVPSQKDRERLLIEKEVIKKNLGKSSIKT